VERDDGLGERRARERDRLRGVRRLDGHRELDVPRENHTENNVGHPTVRSTFVTNLRGKSYRRMAVFENRVVDPPEPARIRVCAVELRGNGMHSVPGMCRQAKPVARTHVP
jgi:hypothetical protein